MKPKSSTRLAAALPDGFAVVAGPGGAGAGDDEALGRILRTADAQGASDGSDGGFFTELADSFADFAEDAARFFEAGWTFVVRKTEEAVEVLVALGTKVVRWAVETLEQMGGFFTWLWTEMRTGLEKLYDWLKLLFEWDDILRVRNAMVDAADESLRYLETSLGSVRGRVETGFEAARSQLARWRAEAGGAPSVPRRPGVGGSVLDAVEIATAPSRFLLDKALGNPVVSWVGDKAGDLVNEVVRLEYPDQSAPEHDSVGEVLEDLLADQIENLVQVVEQLGADLVGIFGEVLPGGGELSLDTIKDTFLVLGTGVLDGILTIVRDLVLRLFDLVGVLLGLLRRILFTRVRFPFVEHLVELVSGGRENLDASFRLIDALTLLCAVPATLTYKIVKGRAPLAEGESPVGPDGYRPPPRVVRGFTQVAELAVAFGLYLEGTGNAVTALMDMGKGAAGDPKDPRTMTKYAMAAFATITWVSEVYGQRDAGDTPEEALEWASIAVGIVLNVKTYAYLLGGARTGNLQQMTKINGAVDAAGAVTRFVLGTAAYGVAMDRLERGSPEELPRSLEWITSLFTCAGKALTSAAVIPDDPQTKAGLLVGGAAGKGYAFVAGVATALEGVGRPELQSA